MSRVAISISPYLGPRRPVYRGILCQLCSQTRERAAKPLHRTPKFKILIETRPNPLEKTIEIFVNTTLCHWRSGMWKWMEGVFYPGWSVAQCECVTWLSLTKSDLKGCVCPTQALCENQLEAMFYVCLRHYSREGTGVVTEDYSYWHKSDERRCGCWLSYSERCRAMSVCLSRSASCWSNSMYHVEVTQCTMLK